MFGIRVLATEEETALITHAARKQGLSASQFVTRVAKRLARNLKAVKIAPRTVSNKSGISASTRTKRRPRPQLTLFG